MIVLRSHCILKTWSLRFACLGLALGVPEVFAAPQSYVAAYVVGLDAREARSVKRSKAILVDHPSQVPWRELVPGTRVEICGEYRTRVVVWAGGNPTAPVTVRGCPLPERPGRLVVSDGHALMVRADHVRIFGLELESTTNAAISVVGHHIVLKDNRIVHSKYGVLIEGQRSTGLKILRNEILDSTLVGIYLVRTGPAGQFVDMKIMGNKILRSGNHGIRIWFEKGSGPESGVRNLVIDGNEVAFGQRDGIVVVHRIADEHTSSPAHFGVRITNNRVVENTGGIALRGLGSLGGAYGDNVVAFNTCSWNRGVTGGINVFWSRYLEIRDNDCSDNRSITHGVDGNGILLDHGNRHVRIIGNRVNRNGDSQGKINSGVGIMILDNVDVKVKNNTMVGNLIGLYFGGQGHSADIRVMKNEVAESARAAVYVDHVVTDGALDLQNNQFRDNSEHSIVYNPNAFKKP